MISILFLRKVLVPIVIQTNTLQAVIITNGTQSYALFIYQCGSLSSSGSRTNNGTIGFNSDGSYFENHPLSGSSKLPEIACLNYPRTAWTNVLYSLTPTSGKIILLAQ